MSLSFRLTTLPITHLAQAMSESSEEAKLKIHHYLSKHAIDSTHMYTFTISMKQGSVVKYLYMAYASVPETAKKEGDIQVIALKRNTFIACDLNQSDYQNLLEGRLEEPIKEYLKQKEIKIDASMGIIGLLEDHGGSYTAYLAYK